MLGALKFYFKCRDNNRKNKESFIIQLKNENWSVLEEIDEPNSAYSYFLAKYTEIYETCFPFKKVKINHYRKPWLSNGLLVSIKRKNKLYKKYLKSPNLSTENIYKTYRNKLNNCLKLAKRRYYMLKIERFKSDSKQTWNILNKIIKRKQSTSKLPTNFFIDNTEVLDPNVIANHFCNFFTNIGSTLADKIQPVNTRPDSYLNYTFPNSIFLTSTDEKEIQQITRSFHSGKAPGNDNIPMGVVKSSIDIISRPLAYIVNLSLSYGIVPDEMKIARVIPLYKAGDRSRLTNYRPISILPSFSKYLERIVYNRLINFINKFHILSNNQYGFRKNYSTSLALISLCDRISAAIDRKEYSVGIFLDLSKAFDTVNHAILLKKLHVYGIRGLALDWIKSYLSNRYQYVQYNGCDSAFQNVSCGVPQGSILGPLLFLLYINDITNVSGILHLILFADDTSVFFSHHDPTSLTNIIQTELQKLSLWFKANKLSLNIDKTKFMVFTPRQKRNKLNITLVIDDKQIKETKDNIFLGVVIDEHLSWKSHISNVANKISKSIGIIYKASFFLSKSSLQTLYYSLVYPYLIYCNIVWASTYKSNLNRILILQKRIVRIMNKTWFLEQTSPLFRQDKILKIIDICSLQMGQFMYSYNHRILPEAFLNLFQKHNEIHNYNTRNARKIILPLCRTNIRRFSVIYQAPRLFNSLPVEIVSCFTLKSFSNKLKKFLLQSY